MASNGLVSRHYKELCEDWVGAENIATSAADGVKWLISSDGGDTAFAITATAQGLILRGATAATNNNMIEIGHAVLGWSVQNGVLEMETRIRFDVITTLAFNVGFNDDQLDDSNTLPIELSTATFTRNSNDWIGVVFDTNATNADVHAAWIDDSATTSTALGTLRFTGMTPVANAWMGIRIVLTDQGSGNAARMEVTVVEESTGKMMQKVFTSTIDRDALLTPHIAVEARDAVAHQCDVDYIYVKMSRDST